MTAKRLEPIQAIERTLPPSEEARGKLVSLEEACTKAGFEVLVPSKRLDKPWIAIYSDKTSPKVYSMMAQLGINLPQMRCASE